MNVKIVNPPGKGGKPSTKMWAYIEGGPELAAKLRLLDKVTRTVASKAGIEAMGEVIRAEWQMLAPYYEGHYKRSLERGAVKTYATPWGAGGTIGPKVVSGVDDDEQPWRYASVLEFGGRIGPKNARGRGTGPYISPRPSARPALDNKSAQAVAAAVVVMRPIVASVASPIGSMPRLASSGVRP